MPTLLRTPTRAYRTPLMDHHRWDNFAARTGDIVVATYPKCGTTWTQRIVDMLIHQSTDARPITETYPWLDATFFAPVEDDLATLEAQTHRRSVKSHLPFDSLPIYEGVKYIHVARDGRDACFSFHNHMLATKPEGAMKIGEQARLLDPNAGPPPPTPQDPREFYLGWIEAAENPEAAAFRGDLPFFDYEMTYWAERGRPNLLLVHYNDLKADLAGEIRRISDFLEIETPADRLAAIAEAAKFESMKAQGGELLAALQTHFVGGHERFLNQGVNGRWKGVLNDDDLARFDRLASARCTPAARAWIEGGRLAAGDPLAAAD